MTDVTTENQTAKTFNAEAFDELGEFVRRVVPHLAIGGRLEVGRKRLAAGLHRLRDVHGKGFGVERFRSLGFGVNFSHVGDIITSFRVRHRVDWHQRGLEVS